MITSLDRALALAGTHDLDDIDIAVGEGRMQRWEGEQTVLITELLQTPKRKTLLFFLAEGNLAEIKAMVPPILLWAKREGCTHAGFIGRFGWERVVAPELGFKTVATMMEREL